MNIKGEKVLELLASSSWANYLMLISTVYSPVSFHSENIVSIVNLKVIAIMFISLLRGQTALKGD